MIQAASDADNAAGARRSMSRPADWSSRGSFRNARRTARSLVLKRPGFLSRDVTSFFTPLHRSSSFWSVLLVCRVAFYGFPGAGF
jgi:hypothetical protein